MTDERLQKICYQSVFDRVTINRSQLFDAQAYSLFPAEKVQACFWEPMIGFRSSQIAIAALMKRTCSGKIIVWDNEPRPIDTRAGACTTRSSRSRYFTTYAT